MEIGTIVRYTGNNSTYTGLHGIVQSYNIFNEVCLVDFLTAGVYSVGVWNLQIVYKKNKLEIKVKSIKTHKLWST